MTAAKGKRRRRGTRARCSGGREPGTRVLGVAGATLPVGPTHPGVAGGPSLWDPRPGVAGGPSQWDPHTQCSGSGPGPWDQGPCVVQGRDLACRTRTLWDSCPCGREGTQPVGFAPRCNGGRGPSPWDSHPGVMEGGDPASGILTLV